MAIIRIEGIEPFDGEHELDLTRFNGRELRQIKQIAGVRGNELSEAIKAGDYDLLIAFAVIALARAGRDLPVEALLEADVGKIILDDDPEPAEEDARPPESSPTQNGSASSDVGESDELAKHGSSGLDSSSIGA